MDTGHAFRGVLPGQRGEGAPGHGCKEAADAARSQVSFLSDSLLQQACCSCSLPARVQEHLSPLLVSQCPAACMWDNEQQAYAVASSGVPKPSSHLGPSLGPSHVCNFYCSWRKCYVCGINCVPGRFLIFSFLTFFTLEYLTES